ncbi:glycoside hydrolase family 1 protein [Cohnella sp. WQ 127256]|uniref:glycoside hydrolase family 1 protein n=1 Tax=Cohnella sp. WQ 127256 TaxID=2938790 RepID=UPI002118BB7D|nr:family 1 glycosylhydrolase [Cohnella sp. WQ 127256]
MPKRESTRFEAFNLPHSLLLGSATASVQIEGGDITNNWYRFCEQGKVKDGTHCIVADDHWNRYEEDIELMKQLNHKVYRMSIEWSRIEPERGKYLEEPLIHYRAEIQKLLDNNIQPLVTLHHFSQPIWFEDMGGWTNPQSVACFTCFAEKVVSYLGDLVAEWITINEPNVYLESTYSSAIFPPEKPSIIHYFKGLRNMTASHIEAYKRIHDIREKMGFDTGTKVGVALHIRVFDVQKVSFLSKLSQQLLEHSFHILFLEGMINGKFMFPIGFGGYPYGKGIYCDFFGVNYYSRDIVAFSWNPLRLFAELQVNKGSEINDMGWEIYPEGLYRICRKYWDIYAKPIYITENGICDATDEQRAAFIYDHLKVISRLVEEGVPVERYYHWSLMDNFEWDEGLQRRFGLIEVNYETQERTIRRSGQFYGELARECKVTDAMIEKFLPMS